MIDTVFSANAYSQQRLKLGAFLKGLPCKTQLWGSWPKGMSEGNTLYDFQKTGEIYRNSKIIIGDNQFTDPGFVSNRFFDSLASGGGMLLHQFVPQLDELLGVKDGEHYVVWHTFEDLAEKIKYYLEHDEERAQIAITGTKYIRENHSFENRVDELNKMIDSIKPEKFSISACMICKNEIQHIDRIIKELSFCEEIVVMDTGSTDGSYEKLLEYQSDRVKILRSKWIDDFAEARNAVLRRCTKEWILHLDFDEHLPPEAIKDIQNFPNWDWTSRGLARPLAYKIQLIDSKSGMSGMLVRLFKRVPDVYWEGRIHETVDASLEKLGIQALHLVDEPPYPFKIIHLGREDAERRMRSERRNIRMLEKEPKTPINVCYLGASLCALDNWALAAFAYMDAMETLEMNDELKDYMNFCIGYCFWMTKFCPRTAKRYLENTNFPDAYFILGEMTKSVDYYLKFATSPPPLYFPTFREKWKPLVMERVKKLIKGII